MKSGHSILHYCQYPSIMSSSSSRRHLDRHIVPKPSVAHSQVKSLQQQPRIQIASLSSCRPSMSKVYRLRSQGYWSVIYQHISRRHNPRSPLIITRKARQQAISDTSRATALDGPYLSGRDMVSAFCRPLSLQNGILNQVARCPLLLADKSLRSGGWTERKDNQERE